MTELSIDINNAGSLFDKYDTSGTGLNGSWTPGEAEAFDKLVKDNVTSNVDGEYPISGYSVRNLANELIGKEGSIGVDKADFIEGLKRIDRDLYGLTQDLLNNNDTIGDLIKNEINNLLKFYPDLENLSNNGRLDADEMDFIAELGSLLFVKFVPDGYIENPDTYLK